MPTNRFVKALNRIERSCQVQDFSFLYAMPSFRVSNNRVTPLILKYFNYITWDRYDIDEDLCSYSYDDELLGFKTQEDCETKVATIRKVLSLPITFNRKKEELAYIHQEELAFLIFFIKEVIYSNTSEDVTDFVYQELVNNYIKVRAFIKQYKIENPRANESETGLTLEVRPNGKSIAAKFDHIDLYYNFNDFLKAIEQQVNVFIPASIKKQLDDPNLPITKIKELYRQPSIEVFDHTKFLKAKAVLLIQEYLCQIPPFNKEEPTASTSGALNLTNDQIRLIYPLFEVMGWEDKADKSNAYIKKFRKRVIHYLPEVLDSLT